MSYRERCDQLGWAQEWILKFLKSVAWVGVTSFFLGQETLLAQSFFVEVEEEAQLEDELQDIVLDDALSEVIMMDLDLQDLIEEEVFFTAASLAPVAGALALKPGLLLRALKGLSSAVGSKAHQLMMVLGLASTTLITVVWQMRGAPGGEWGTGEQHLFSTEVQPSSSKPPQKPLVLFTAEELLGEDFLEPLPVASEHERTRLKKEQEMIIEAYNQGLALQGGEVSKIPSEQRFQIMQEIVLGRMAQLSSHSQNYFSKFLVVFAESDLIKEDLLSVSTLSSIEDALKSVVVIYTDGGCAPKNPGPGGWAALLSYGGYEKMLRGSYFPETTNNRMEIMAVIEGLKCLKREGLNVGVFSDSEYVCNAANSGGLMEGWKQKGWKNSKKKQVPNKDFWKKLDDQLQKHHPRFFHVYGHKSVEGNERADEGVHQARDQRINVRRDWEYEKGHCNLKPT